MPRKAQRALPLPASNIAAPRDAIPHVVAVRKPTLGAKKKVAMNRNIAGFCTRDLGAISKPSVCTSLARN